MPTCFFKTEICNIQTQFNEVFGNRIVFNIKARQLAIFAIIQLNILEQQIIKTKIKDEVRNEIKQFVRGRDILRKLFANIESSQPKQNYNKKCIESRSIRIANA